MPPRRYGEVNEFRLCELDGRFWVARADGDPRDMVNWDTGPEATALRDFVMAARDAGLDKEGILGGYAKEHERRRKIGETIDPAIAEVQYCWSIDIDPYDMIPLFEWRSDCYSQSERTMFARSPGDEWVVREDLPDATYDALTARQDRWRANGAIDDILDALNKTRKLEKGTIQWYAPTYEPCAAGVRVNLESHDGAKAAIEFSLDDPDARRAAKEQLGRVLEV